VLHAEARIGSYACFQSNVRELFLRRVPTSFSTRASRLQMSTEETKIRSVRYSFLKRAVGMSQ
jgi:hypothetical protein